MQASYTIWKNWGETPLEALERLRAEEHISSDVPMTYAGRLDPAAEGLLIMLTGEECKKKDEYNALSKTYKAEILFGVSTDSYDLLGIPTLGVIPASEPESMMNMDGSRIKSGKTMQKPIQSYLDEHIGAFTQTYPPYSSKTVDGIQLHAHAQKGNEVVLPTHEVEMYGYSELVFGERTREEIVARAVQLAKIVKGDFRQAEIARAWTDLLPKLPEKLQTISIELKVSSGFYIRQLAEDLGRTLGGGACLYSLIRTEII